MLGMLHKLKKRERKSENITVEGDIGELETGVGVEHSYTTFPGSDQEYVERLVEAQALYAVSEL